jgi:alpha-D-ribose 1-methylphosphonate 5-triphosphate synthase subunit PhnH
MTATIKRGFANPAAGSQAVFRAVLSAMSEPGRMWTCPALPEGSPLQPVIAAVALTLLDYETPLFLAGRLGLGEARDFLAFHTGAPVISEPARAAFVIAASADDLPPIDSLSAGTPDYPDRSATVILGVSGFETGTRVSLRGPGIPDFRSFQAGGLEASFWRLAIGNASRFPLGVDFLFCGPDALAALPRSTQPSFAE